MTEKFDLERQKQARFKLYQDVVSKDTSDETSFLLELPTGVGKTFLSASIIHRDLHVHQSKTKWLIVSPTILQCESLKADFEKLNFNSLLDPTQDNKIEDIICYQSLKKYAEKLKGKEISIWFDEVHRLSNLKADIFNSFNVKRIIFASAVIPSKTVKVFYHAVSKKENRVYIYKTLKDAILEGLLPKLNIIFIKIPVSSEKNIVVKNSKTKTTTLSSLKDEINRYSELVKKYGKIFPRNFLYFNANKKFKSYIADVKTPFIKKFHDFFSKEDSKNKTLLFCSSIEQMEEIDVTRCVNYKKSPKENKQVMNSFISGDINTIMALGMMKEGVNLTGITQGLVSNILDSTTGDSISFIQEVGRTTRSLNPKIYIVTIDHEVEEKAMEKIKKLFGKSANISNFNSPNLFWAHQKIENN